MNSHLLPSNFHDTSVHLQNKPLLNLRQVNYIDPSGQRRQTSQLISFKKAEDHVDEIQGLPLIMSFDIETFSEKDPNGSLSRLNKLRKTQRDELNNSNDALVDFLLDQRIFMLSCVFGFLGVHEGEPTIFVTKSHLLWLKYGPMTQLDSFSLESFFTHLIPCESECELLMGFNQLFYENRPTFITGHNVSNFDLCVLKSRFADRGLILHKHTFLPPYVNFLSQKCKQCVIVDRDLNCLILDTFVFAKRYFTNRFGFGLSALCKPLIGQSKMMLSPKHYFLTPMDFLKNRNTIQDRVNVATYCVNDSFLALKLCVLFQRSNPIIDTFKSVKTTLSSTFKHLDVIQQIKTVANNTHQLRMHTSFCVKLYLQSLIERHLPLPTLDDQFFQSVMAHLRFISCQHYHVKMKRPSSSISTDLKNFIYALDNFEPVIPNRFPGYKHLLLVSGPQYMPRFPGHGFARMCEYLSQVMVANLETNLSLRYCQHVQRFVNVFFNKNQIDDFIEKYYKGMVRQVKSLARLRLRQVKDLFLNMERFWLEDIVNSFNNNRGNAARVLFMIAFNDQLQVFASHLGFNRNDTLNLYNGLLYPMIDAHFDNFFGQAILLTIFPRTINNKDGTTETVEKLLEAVHKNPQQFLRPALLLSVEIEKLGGSPYVVTPLTTNNVPGFCTIDTRTLVAIINVKANQQKRRLMNKYEQVKKFCNIFGSLQHLLHRFTRLLDLRMKLSHL
ncbi:hypothetical protein RCL1_008989 [Eukaryota sp. TZLM3-RCL]